MRLRLDRGRQYPRRPVKSSILEKTRAPNHGQKLRPKADSCPSKWSIRHVLRADDISAVIWQCHESIRDFLAVLRYVAFLRLQEHCVARQTGQNELWTRLSIRPLIVRWSRVGRASNAPDYRMAPSCCPISTGGRRWRAASRTSLAQFSSIRVALISVRRAACN